MYFNGKFCCATNKEKNKGLKSHGKLCNGSQIKLKSMCCENNAYHPCSSPPCTNFINGKNLNFLCHRKNGQKNHLFFKLTQPSSTKGAIHFVLEKLIIMLTDHVPKNVAKRDIVANLTMAQETNVRKRLKPPTHFLLLTNTTVSLKPRISGLFQNMTRTVGTTVEVVGNAIGA